MSHQFYPLTVREVRRETADTVSVSFNVPAAQHDLFKFKAGQYLTLKKELNGADTRRAYSICSAPHENELRVAIKKVHDGVFSTFATSQLQAGDTLEIMPPKGHFCVTPESQNMKNYVFFAAGSGITPVISMIKALLQTETGSTVYLYYVNKSKADTIFQKELDELAEKNLNLNLFYLFTREESGNPLTNGRLDQTKLNVLFNTHLAHFSIGAIYSCGPKEMVTNIKEFFITKGVPTDRIHFELFTATPVSDEKKATANQKTFTADVTVIIDDEKYKFQLESTGKSILQAAQDAGADVPFSCKGGVCCTCKAKVMEGSAKMDLNYALEPDEVDAGFILTCQSHPTSEKIVVSFDEY